MGIKINKSFPIKSLNWIKLSLFFILLLFQNPLFSQQENPIKWEYSLLKKSDSTYTLSFKAAIEKGWHLYSQYIPPNATLPTEFVYEEEGVSFELIGKNEESQTIFEYDEIFETKLSFFENYAEFTQQILLKNDNLSGIEGEILYQVCDDEVCLFRTQPFSFSFNNNYKNAQLVVDNISKKKIEKLQLDLKNTFYLENKVSSDSKNNYLNLFLLGFLGGLIALLTPCVFPMIPITLSYFLKQSSKLKNTGIKKALLYGFFIVFIYFIISLPFHFLDNITPGFLNSIATNMYVNILFFIIFIFFAFSFFGFYELSLPNSWANKLDSKSLLSGGIGVFFMALTLVIVSFSCTGPILGTLLASSLTIGKGALQLTSGMLGFGVALALPFTLFAFFPSKINIIPKSGPWLGTVKITLGFIELALALKFLSNADLVAHWGILKREVFLILWIIIFIFTIVYLIRKGLLIINKKYKNTKLVSIHFIISALIICFTIYLLLGLLVPRKVSLNYLSGFPPPKFYSVFKLESNCPLGLNCYKDFEQGKKEAIKQNKPILLDFTGWACVNCRKMEENIWAQPNIFKLIDDNFILTSLYVDDRRKLDDIDQFNFKYSEKYIRRIKNIGDKWAAFQWLNFNNSSQPFYILINPDGTLLNSPIQYTDAATYENWLTKGLENFKNTQ